MGYKGHVAVASSHVSNPFYAGPFHDASLAGKTLAWEPVVESGDSQHARIARVKFSLGEEGHAHMEMEPLNDIDLGSQASLALVDHWFLLRVVSCQGALPEAISGLYACN